MSRLAVSYARPRPLLPIDPHGFPVVVHPTSWSDLDTGQMLLAAMDAAGDGVIVEVGDTDVEIKRFAAVRLPFLLGMLAEAGFDRVQVSPEPPQVDVVYASEARLHKNGGRVGETFTCRFPSLGNAVGFPPPDGFTSAHISTPEGTLTYRALFGWEKHPLPV